MIHGRSWGGGGGGGESGPTWPLTSLCLDVDRTLASIVLLLVVAPRVRAACDLRWCVAHELRPCRRRVSSNQPGLFGSGRLTGFSGFASCVHAIFDLVVPFPCTSLFASRGAFRPYPPGFSKSICRQWPALIAPRFWSMGPSFPFQGEKKRRRDSSGSRGLLLPADKAFGLPCRQRPALGALKWWLDSRSRR